MSTGSYERRNVRAEARVLTENGGGAMVVVGFVGCEIDFTKEPGKRRVLVGRKMVGEYRLSRRLAFVHGA